MSEPIALVALALLTLLVVFDTLVLVGVVAIVHDLRSSNRALLPETSLRAGDRAPDFAGNDIDGHPVTSQTAIGRVRAILFVSSSCSSCYASLEELQALESKSRGDLLLVCRGTPDECRAMTSTFNLPWPLVADERGEIGRVFGISKYPMAVLLDEDWRVRSVGQPKRSELETALEAAGTTT